MAKLDAEWLAEKGRTVRSTEPHRGLYDRLKFVAALIAESPKESLLGPSLIWRDEIAGRVETMPVTPHLVIGRDPSCDLVLRSPRVSRRHCEIRILHGAVWLSDLGSTNGTIHNGVRLEVPAPLRDGDMLEIGGLVLVFVS